MNREGKWGINKAGDEIAVKLQSLRADVDAGKERPLIRLDYREQGKKAPFQFDVANAMIHSTGCGAIPESSRYALYAMWELRKKDLKFACRKCRPEQYRRGKMKKDATSDIIYGFLSILDQFGSVLAERGKEYRNSREGRRTEKTINTILSELDHRQKEGINSAISSIDSLIKIVHGYNDVIKKNGNGKGSVNGGRRSGMNGNGRRTGARQK